MALTHEQLFLLTLQDIRNKVSIGTEYELVRACGLCRQLFVDYKPLYSLVNEKYKLKIEWVVVNWGKFRKMRMHVNWLNPDPTTLPNKPTISLSINQYKSHEILSLYNHSYTVQEVILGGSNYMGGVHAGVPKNNKERALAAIEEIVKDKDSPVGLYMLRAICSIIITAMDPLEKAINGHTSTGET